MLLYIPMNAESGSAHRIPLKFIGNRAEKWSVLCVIRTTAIRTRITTRTRITARTEISRAIRTETSRTARTAAIRTTTRTEITQISITNKSSGNEKAAGQCALLLFCYGNTAQSPPDGSARHLLASFSSYFTKSLVNTQSIHCVFCFI